VVVIEVAEIRLCKALAFSPAAIVRLAQVWRQLCRETTRCLAGHNRDALPHLSKSKDHARRFVASLEKLSAWANQYTNDWFD
jgi:hypothetical protein